MTDAEAAGQKLVWEIADQFENLNNLLRAVHDSFPASPLEAVILAGEADPDVATALRSTIECVLADQLEPALRELRTWAAYKPPGEEGVQES
jgi:hypothetical protein